MNDEDIEILKLLIHTKRGFRIGKKGICLNLIWNGHRWFGEIPRADVTLNFSRLVVYETADGFNLHCEWLGGLAMIMTLDEYDSLTVME